MASEEQPPWAQREEEEWRIHMPPSWASGVPGSIAVGHLQCSYTRAGMEQASYPPQPCIGQLRPKCHSDLLSSVLGAKATQPLTDDCGSKELSQGHTFRLQS